MYTVTKDLPLPTAVTGSWPGPRWHDMRLDGRSFSTCMKDAAFREQFGDALSAVLDDQERAGLDILTHGDAFHDDDLGGSSWLTYPLERWNGLDGDHVVESEDLPDYPAGTSLGELWSGWRWPRVVGKVGPSEEKPLDYAKIWRLAQARTEKPVIFGTISSQQFSLFLEPDGVAYDRDAKRELIW